MTITKDWKFYLGIALFSFSWLPYIFVFLVLPFLKLHSGRIITLAAVNLFLSYTTFLLALFFLGKPFLNFIKQKLIWFTLKKIARQRNKPVGKIRHLIGVSIFLISTFIPGIIVEITLLFSHSTANSNAMILIMVTGNIMFIASLFILGINFIFRLKKLFTWHDIKQF